MKINLSIAATPIGYWDVIKNYDVYVLEIEIFD